MKSYQSSIPSKGGDFQESPHDFLKFLNVDENGNLTDECGS